MKEIGKLIELLNEYEDGMVSWVKEYVEEFGVFVLNTEQMIEEEIIISKSFGFIKWLVDNDKIRKDIYRPIPFKIKIEYEDSVRYIEKLEDRILMELSIQENPIEFLVSILK